MGTLDAPHPALLAALTALTAIVTLLRTWIRHRTAVRVEEEHTRRVRIAVEGSARGQRAEVVWACAELEAASWEGAVRRRLRPVERS
ncbi:hypothetical protein JK364_16655 [Streptomyces sp. 110]|uniref:Secreted protein n=1 Tax=Streptomyces endocoffeicus TaxID=2898945 RepID=A0ABS1PNM0_9ACTN|nr:hypothetical protein [Streptomyces endocoffeicus]MBL1114012.1 hypothetical protein [Streptomyces endocoffeicus]